MITTTNNNTMIYESQLIILKCIFLLSDNGKLIIYITFQRF